jgi:hypothetical protein
MLDSDASCWAAQTRALRYAWSLTVTVMFFMGSHSEGVGLITYSPLYSNCAPEGGYFLQKVADGFGLILAGRSACAFSGLKSGIWGTRAERGKRLEAGSMSALAC